MRAISKNTVVPGFSVLGFRALPGFRALCTGNQIWIYVINLPGFSALPGFKAPFHGDEQSALNPGTTVLVGFLEEPDLMKYGKNWHGSAKLRS